MVEAWYDPTNNVVSTDKNDPRFTPLGQLWRLVPERERSFSNDVGRLLKAGKGFYDDGTPIDYKDIQLKIEGTGEDTFECVEVRIPRPPQREWIGLTDEERKQVRSSTNYNQFMTAGEYAEAVQKATEAKLREKNT
jgi:hypothetical protein